MGCQSHLCVLSGTGHDSRRRRVVAVRPRNCLHIDNFRMVCGPGHGSFAVDGIRKGHVAVNLFPLLCRIGKGQLSREFLHRAVPCQDSDGVRPRRLVCALSDHCRQRHHCIFKLRRGHRSVRPDQLRPVRAPLDLKAVGGTGNQVQVLGNVLPVSQGLLDLLFGLSELVLLIKLCSLQDPEIIQHHGGILAGAPVGPSDLEEAVAAQNIRQAVGAVLPAHPYAVHIQDGAVPGIDDVHMLPPGRTQGRPGICGPAAVIVITLRLQVSVLYENTQIFFFISVGAPAQHLIAVRPVVYPVGAVRSRQDIIGNCDFLIPGKEASSVRRRYRQIVLILFFEAGCAAIPMGDKVHASPRSPGNAISALEALLQIVKGKVRDHCALRRPFLYRSSQHRGRQAALKHQGRREHPRQ